MCGIIGYVSDKPKKEHKLILSNLMYESRIRGMHAFGLAYGEYGSTLKVKKFFKVEEACEEIMKNCFSLLIAHSRYDTSGDWKVIENNQPITIGKDVLVFNGVIRMCSKNKYEKEFNEKYTTENDGEIILKFLHDGNYKRAQELIEEKKVSYAGIHYVKQNLFAMRNIRRPLWYLSNGETQLVVSTLDIANRAMGDSFSDFEKEKVMKNKVMAIL